MTYQQTLDWMFSKLPMFQKEGKSALKHKLDNIINLSSYLGNPHKKIKTIHVAGTNGKGSSSHMIASVLQEAGYKVGLYTSPHLKDFRERIKINGKEISESDVITFADKNKSFIEEHSLSFFEMTVGMAFQYFAQQNVDIAIIEAGLGGRLDSTNIITPEVSLITNIGKDHTDILGDTLEKIAYEKAGIIKNNIPVVISEFQIETADVFKKIAQQKNAPIAFASELLCEKLPYISDFQGFYQQKNIKGVVAVIKELQKRNWSISEENIKNGIAGTIANTNLLGRWQKLGENPTIVCDTAHNEAGLRIVLEQLKIQTYHQLHIVLGFVKEKDISVVLGEFPKDAIYYFAKPNVPRGLSADILQWKAQEFDLIGDTYPSVVEALQAAKSYSRADDFIYVGGSTFVVAEVI